MYRGEAERARARYRYLPDQATPPLQAPVNLISKIVMIPQRTKKYLVIFLASVLLLLGVYGMSFFNNYLSFFRLP